mmetsp:Transcript_57378/g.147537  ORF Transcript_57378/g.147537 Transcript_57378/m.147537 type:complete len:366 (-) Transcript_57378:96-1193(-)
MGEMQRVASLPRIVQRRPLVMDPDSEEKVQRKRLELRRRMTFDVSQLSKTARIHPGSKERPIRLPLTPQGSRQNSKTIVGARSSSTGALAPMRSGMKNPVDLKSWRTPEDQLAPEDLDAPIPAASTPVRSDSLRNAWVGHLARKYSLDTSEVKNIVLQFDTAGKGEEEVTYKQFRDALCTIFERSDIKESVIVSAWSAITDSEPGQDARVPQVDVEAFLSWYVANMFSVVAALTCSADDAASEDHLYQLAKKYSVSPYTMDKVKRRFNQVDVDKSGLISYGEFEAMMRKILRAPKKDDLGDERMQRFWQEIDQDGSGEVDFEEFAQWYLKYFNPETEDEVGCPLAAFYASFNPDAQRRNLARNSH